MLLDGLFDRIQSLEQALQITPTISEPNNFADAISSHSKRSFSTEFRKKLATSKTPPEKNELLTELWESRDNPNKRLFADLTSVLFFVVLISLSFLSYYVNQEHEKTGG